MLARQVEGNQAVGIEVTQRPLNLLRGLGEFPAQEFCMSEFPAFIVSQEHQPDQD